MLGMILASETKKNEAVSRPDALRSNREPEQAGARNYTQQRYTNKVLEHVDLIPSITAGKPPELQALA
jgi:hypothetical protein